MCEVHFVGYLCIMDSCRFETEYLVYVSCLSAFISVAAEFQPTALLRLDALVIFVTACCHRRHLLAPTGIS